MKYIAGLPCLSFIMCMLITTSCTKKEIPVVSTSKVTDIAGNTATGGGTLVSEGSADIRSSGVCWSTKSNPTTADEHRKSTSMTEGSFICPMNHLTGNTLYYLRAYAVNRYGTGYGNEVKFLTGPNDIFFSEWVTYGTVQDGEGNKYKTVNIGQQTWMAENLRSEHYLDGSPVPEIKLISNWTDANSGAFCYFDNDTLNRRVYGALYNWYVVDDSRKICPAGWHVPSYDEWVVLENCLGGKEIAGMKLKEAGSSHWVEPNIGAGNQSGFSALPGGSRFPNVYEDFHGIGFYGRWWTSTANASDSQSAWYCSLSKTDIILERKSYWKIDGYSIRCIKD